jgi:O-antigen ligase
VGYFVDIPKPKAWPPPKDGTERVNELLEYGYKRDPVGDKVHTWFACLFLFCLPLDVYPTTIATWALFIYSVMRLPSTWRALTPLYNASIYRLMIAWTAWSILSIAWSPNLYVGWDHAGALRMVLLPIVLWPVMRHWKYFLGAFLMGVLLQNCVQISEVVGSWFLDGRDWLTGEMLSSPSGWETHTGKAAMFMGFASISWIGIVITNKRYRKTATVCLLLATAGMFATASMAVTVGFIAATSILSLILVCAKRFSAKQLVATITTLILVLLVSDFFVKDTITSKTERAIQGVQDFYDGTPDAGNSTQHRLHWWAETLKRTFDDPAIIHGVVGHGFGSVASIDFSKEGSSVDSLAEHIHNSYIQILYEQGVVGLSLFLLLLWKMIQTAKATSGRLPELVYPICVSCTVLWAVATFFENSQSSGRPLAMLILLALFIMYMYQNTLGNKRVNL